jgi:ammonia channel protein AmtB
MIFVSLKIIQVTMGLRVSEQVEVGGLDEYEHGASAYRGEHIAWNRRDSDKALAQPKK